MASKRLTREIALLKSHDMYGETVYVDETTNEKCLRPIAAQLITEDDLFQWKATLLGEEPYYGGGRFVVKVNFPVEYPFKPPMVTFETKVYHPGINSEGQICLKELTGEWQPAMFFYNLLTSIRDKLNHPSVEDPFVPDIAAILKENKKEFEATAKEWTEKFAKPKKS